VKTVTGAEAPLIQIHIRNISSITMLVSVPTLPFRQPSRIFIWLSYSDILGDLAPTFTSGGSYSPPCSAAPTYSRHVRDECIIIVRVEYMIIVRDEYMII
jgi:hypothetical protein